jgi:hypothetical protein
MPIHDWTRLESYLYHDFHTSFIVAARRTINSLLPPGYYALAEQNLQTMGPDVLTLQFSANRQPILLPGDRSVATMEATRSNPFTATETAWRSPGFAQKHIAVRHRSGDRIIAVVELVSPGNKASTPAVKQFVKKVVKCVATGIHAVVLDPFPPTPRDPYGLYPSIWKRLSGQRPSALAKNSLQFVAYESRPGDDPTYRSYVETAAVGQPWPVLPLFLAPDEPIAVDFEPIYNEAFRDVVPEYREVLEG